MRPPSGGLRLLPGAEALRTFVYVDGSNLYYGIRKTPYKWLDVRKFCQLTLPHNEIACIKYYTARVTYNPDNPQQQKRQKAYWRALRTIPEMSIHRGHFLSHVCRLPLASAQPGKPSHVDVIRTEEKGSDVNLATHLLWDAFRDRYDVAVIVSNDSDLLEPIKLVRSELGKIVGIINPHTDSPSVDLRANSDFFRTISRRILRESQFPISIVDSNGTFGKPVTW